MNNNHKAGEKQAFTPENQSSRRSSRRPEFEREQTAEERLVSLANGSDSIAVSAISTPMAEAMRAASANATKASKDRTKRVARQQLIRLEERLTAREHSVLDTICRYRFMTSDQVGRLFFQSCTTKTSRSRNQNLLLQKLNEYGLIKPLERRVGGVGGGSGMQIWHLTEAGHKLLTLNEPDTMKRKRFLEPSPQFLEHTLAITECMVQLTLICRYSHDLELMAVDTEPTSWRRFSDNGAPTYLKPDMFAITNYDNYEDRWFIEMDLSSESPRTVVEKCDQYLRYYYSGIEQKETGMFPFVVWIVKDETRKERLKEYIRDGIKAQPKMFLVITPDELEKLLRQDIDAKELM